MTGVQTCALPILCEPWNYYTRIKWLHSRFVSGLREYFRDPRADWQFYRQGMGTFNFKAANYRQSWDALSDVDLLARLAGFHGLVVLVDEFEDVLYNLRRLDYQQEAFWNLFRLFDGEVAGHSFYAVTPGFVQKCKERLQTNGIWDYDFARFERLPTFEMAPLECNDLEELALRILHTHGVAYGWEPDLIMKMSQLRSIVKEAASMQTQDRARHTITTVVRAIDTLFQEIE